jgi:membrane-associated phospholipid phosphatase
MRPPAVDRSYRGPLDRLLPPLPALTALRGRIAAAAGLAVAYVALTMAVAAGLFNRLDEQVLQGFVGLWSESLHPLFQAIAELGGLEVTTLLMSGLLIYLLRRGFGADAWVVLAFVAAQALELFYKATLYHPGPPRSIAHTDGPSITELVSSSGPLANSFPSGHMVRAVVVYGLIAFVVQRLAPWSVARRLAFPVATVLIVLLAFDRLYLDVHWESDVLGGLLLGAVALLAGSVWLDRPLAGG